MEEHVQTTEDISKRDAVTVFSGCIFFDFKQYFSIKNFQKILKISEKSIETTENQRFNYIVKFKYI